MLTEAYVKRALAPVGAGSEPQAVQVVVHDELSMTSGLRWIVLKAVQ